MSTSDLIKLKIEKLYNCKIKQTNGFKPTTDPPVIHFNISKSNAYTICITSHEEVGVDITPIECILQHNDLKTLIECDCEVDSVLWAIYECYFKYIGTGLIRSYKIKADHRRFDYKCLHELNDLLDYKSTDYNTTFSNWFHEISVEDVTGYLFKLGGNVGCAICKKDDLLVSQ